MTEIAAADEAAKVAEEATTGDLPQMDPLMASLGLDKVTGDPNSVPDGTYDAVVYKIEYVHAKNKGTLADVLTYRVDAPGSAHHGAQITHWFTLGKDPVFDDNGNPISYTPTQTEGNKTFYKKAFLDLGVPANMVGRIDKQTLVGKKIVVTLKTSTTDARYQNVTNVTLRNGDAAPSAGASPAASAAVSIDEFDPESL